jgi:hypothetical protein
MKTKAADLSRIGRKIYKIMCVSVVGNWTHEKEKYNLKTTIRDLIVFRE